MKLDRHELERFKIEVNLSEYAATQGYCLDRKESSRNSAVMRHPNGDKIIISRSQQGGVWVYFSVRDNKDNGTVIDFIQNRVGGGLGKVRAELRDWAGISHLATCENTFAKEIVPVTRDRAKVLRMFELARLCTSLPYLTSRGIGPEILELPRFAGCVKVDSRRNALFPHYDREGLCGFEIKNKGFTGFSSGGIKGLWCSRTRGSDTQLVLAESAIDALSYHALYGDDYSRYMSTGGELNPQQPELLRSAMERLQPGAMVVLAFDNDAGGEKIEGEVRAVTPPGRELCRVLPDSTFGAKDWNDVLKRHLGLI